MPPAFPATRFSSQTHNRHQGVVTNETSVSSEAVSRCGPLHTHTTHQGCFCTRDMEKIGHLSWGNGLCCSMNISPVFKFNDIVSQFMKSDQDSLIPFNFFFKGGEKQRDNVSVSLKLISLRFFLKVPF